MHSTILYDIVFLYCFCPTINIMVIEPGPTRGRGTEGMGTRLRRKMFRSKGAEQGEIRIPGVDRLLAYPVPGIPSEQLNYYRRENLQMRPAGSFNVAETIALQQRSVGTRVGYYDVGADKAAAGILEVGKDGNFGVLVNMDPRIKQDGEEGGTGYVAFGEDARAMFNANGVLIVGTSFAGPTRGTQPEVATNIRVMKRDLDSRYHGDLAELFQPAEPASPEDKVTVAGDNDGVAALVAATIEARKRNPQVERVYSFIFGGGNGGSISEIDPITDVVQLIASEPGHVPVIPEMNPFGRVEACGQDTSRFKDETCIEKVGGSGEGVEKTFLQETGLALKGIEISEIHQNRDGLYSDELSEKATRIYDAAARVVATEAVGMDQALGPVEVGGKPLDPANTTIVIHGGLTKTPGVAERIGQILRAHMEQLGYDHVPDIIYTKDFSDNACADGAATMALMAQVA